MNITHESYLSTQYRWNEDISEYLQSGLRIEGIQPKVDIVELLSCISVSRIIQFGLIRV